MMAAGNSFLKEIILKLKFPNNSRLFNTEYSSPNKKRQISQNLPGIYEYNELCSV